ncbi:MAG: hypothetical protein Ct9H300mP13_7640 [Gammaproteobacteria bacterium]|nr:MAG: hypothetical protein Ct9H300mP13_7640 [Gammaproteobacteria bacterium]
MTVSSGELCVARGYKKRNENPWLSAPAQNGEGEGGDDQTMRRPECFGRLRGQS